MVLFLISGPRCLRVLWHKLWLLKPMVKTFRALHYQKCFKHLKKNKDSRNTYKRAIFQFQVEYIKISDTFYNIQNFLGTSRSSIIASYLIKLLSSWPLQQQNILCRAKSSCCKFFFIQNLNFLKFGCGPRFKKNIIIQNYLVTKEWNEADWLNPL